MMTAPPPELEMLWEQRDPAAALAERFGFADRTDAERWVASVLAERWGIEVLRCERIVMSDRNALAWLASRSGRLVAKWSVAPERFHRLAQLARLTTWLGAKGLPVAAPIPALDGGVQVQVDAVSLGLQREVPGALLDTDDEDLVRASGAVLGRLHTALSAYPDSGSVMEGSVVEGSSSPTPLADRVDGWLETCPQEVPSAARAVLRQRVADAGPDPLAAQLVHGDYRSANVLCREGAVAAVLDFEEARLACRVDELARSAVLLGTRFRDWGPVTADVRDGFLAGYQSQVSLTGAERRWWGPLVLWYSLAMIPQGPDPTGWGPAAMSQLETSTP
jgi:homoserine kinase type II